MEALIDRVPSAPYGVAADYIRRLTAADQDGDSWELRVCDGSATKGLKVSVSFSAKAELGLQVLDAESLDAVVERASGRITEHSRLVDPLPNDLVLRPDDFIRAL